MKFHHYAIIFAAIAIVFILMHDISYAQMLAAYQETDALDQAFEKAIDAAANQLILDDKNSIIISAKESASVFLDTLYSALDIQLDPAAKESIQLYLPLFAAADYDGIYLWYYDKTILADGTEGLSHTWSERIPYIYETDSIRYEFTMSEYGYVTDKATAETTYTLLDSAEMNARRKETISRVIEKTMKDCIKTHNYIASQYGISYEFQLPIEDNSVTERAVNTPSLFVMFQGYPLRGTDKVYQRFAFHGASVKKQPYYIVTKKDWYYLYHRADCTQLLNECEEAKKAGTELEKILAKTKRECAEYGAYPCPKCMDDSSWYDFLKN